MGVADQRHPLPLGGQPAGLLDRQERLAASRSPADLDPFEQCDGVQDGGLTFGERVGGVVVRQGTRDDVALRQPAPAQGDQ